MRDQVAQACSPRLLRYAGGDQQTRRLSRLEVVWFMPSADAADAGASWFRCDIVGIAAADRLVRLPRTVKGALDAPDALDTFGTCGTKAPGKPGFGRVVCRRKHAWRAVDTVDIDRKARYLGKVSRRARRLRVPGRRRRSGRRRAEVHLELRVAHPRAVGRRPAVRLLLGAAA